MTEYTFYWKDGRREILTEDEALPLIKNDSYETRRKMGLSFYAKGVCNNFTWYKYDKQWLRKDRL